MGKSTAIGILLAAMFGAGVTAFSMRGVPHGRPSVLLTIDRSGPPSAIPPIRVLLTPKLVVSIEIQIDGPYRVQPAGDWRILAQGDRLAPHTVEVLSDGFRIGDRKFPVTRLEIIPLEHPTLWIGDSQYRGTVRFIRRPGGKMAVVGAVGLEDYLASVLNSELPADFPLAARQTQAIAARTYALYQMKAASPSGYYDLRNNSSSQVYRGVQYRQGSRRLAVETPDSRQIVDQTRGIVATYRGRLFCTYYSAICGGRTTHGGDVFDDAAPPLMSVPCDWCRGSKYYRWEKDLSQGAIETKLHRWTDRQRKRALGTLQRIEVIGNVESGHVPQVRVTGNAASVEMSAYAFRLAVNPRELKSGFFSVEARKNVFHFQGRGWGHGVGLCQWGARGQALAGRTCVGILQHYYPGSTLVAIQ